MDNKLLIGVCALVAVWQLPARGDPITVLAGGPLPVSLSGISGGILSPSGNSQDADIISETSDYNNAVVLKGGNFIPLATDDNGYSANLVSNPDFTYGYVQGSSRFLPYGPGSWTLSSSGDDVVSYGAITVLLPSPEQSPTVASQELYMTAGTKYVVLLELFQAAGSYGISLGDVTYGLLPVDQQAGGAALTEDYFFEYTATSDLTNLVFTAQVSPDASLGQPVAYTPYAGSVIDSVTILAEAPVLAMTSDPAPLDPVQVPEPDTLTMLGGFLIAAGLGRWLQEGRQSVAT